MSTARARLMRRARRYMAIWKVNIGLDNDLGLTDINSDAEDFCCGLLNIVLDLQLRNMNLLKMNFPAIDLADSRRRICVQVTSTAGAEKIMHTLERFFAHGLEKDYDRLIVLILGDKKKYRTEFPKREGFHFEPAQNVWDIQKLLTQIASLSMVKLAQVDAYLREQFGDLSELASPMDLPVLSALDDTSFLGRDDELEAIAKRFEENERIVILSGLGGMGKSELAVRFAQTKWSGESYFVRFTKNWRHTVLENIVPRIRELNRDTLDADEIYRDAMAKLKHRGADELLILDNVDQEYASLTQLKRELSELNVRILITTRTDAEHAIPVETLHRGELLRFFELHESVATAQEQIALIEAVDGHTLTVDLMARALRPGRRAATAKKLLNNLADSSVRKVDTAYPGSPAQARIIEHLKVVFQVLKLEEYEKELLRYAALLPEGGMTDALFLASIDEDREDTLDNLINNGWLCWQDGLLLIHPIIRKVCFEELSITDENCVAFLSGLTAQYDSADYQPDRYCQMAELLTNASFCLANTSGWCAAWASHLWRDVGNFTQALKCDFRAIEKAEMDASTDAHTLATLYSNVGGTFSELVDHRKALEYEQKALSIREKALPAEDLDLAISYNSIGCTFGELGDHKTALKYQHNALVIREKVLPSEHPDLATSYNNVGCTYSELGNFKIALEYQQKALAIREKVLPLDHPSLAGSYHSLGNTYGKLGNQKESLNYALKALAIHEKVLPAEHPNLAHSYNNVASAYHSCGNRRMALENMLKALAIQEKVLPEDHPHLAISCGNIAWIIHEIGNLQDAAQYMRRAEGIISRSSLPQTHPQRMNITNLAVQFEKEAKMQQAIVAQTKEWGTNPFGLPRK